MKATEVLNRYANGERDFRRVSLRGQSFRKQDLSGADFSESDIRGASFANTNLANATFIGSKAGSQKRWRAFAFLIILLISILSSIFVVVGEYPAVSLLHPMSAYYNLTLGFLYLIGYFLVCYLFIKGGFLGVFKLVLFICITQFIVSAMFATLNISYDLSRTISSALVYSYFSEFTQAANPLFSILSSLFTSITYAFSITFLYTLIFIMSFTLCGLLITILLGIANLLMTFLLILLFAGGANVIRDIGSVATDFASGGVAVFSAFIYQYNSLILIAFIMSLLNVMLGFYITHQAISGNKKFAYIRSVGVTLSSIGGTSFEGADLTDSNFSNAMLRNTNFEKSRYRATNLTRVRWINSKNLNFARVQGSILEDASVRELVVSGNGSCKTYIEANLRGVNLDSANLSNANLQGADLRDSTLKYANLQEANLAEIVAIGTNFEETRLTGACIENWLINHTTKLKKIECQYFYLLRDQKERYPNKDTLYEGEFTQIFQKIIDRTRLRCPDQST